MGSDPIFPGLGPGARLDRFELIYLVAMGGMGAVWAARVVGPHGLGKVFAIKTILPGLAGDARCRTMLLDEARIAIKVDHPNVAHTVELGEDGGVLYLVMEWIDGDSLQVLYRASASAGRRLPVALAVRIAADACAGLHAAHEVADESGRRLNVVHRDVSPSNILLTSAGGAKLIDFGIARAEGRFLGDKSTGGLKGKARYMAPEQVTGSRIDRRADVWAMGATLQFLLTGEAPFVGEHDVAVLCALAKGQPPLPLPASVPTPVARVIRRALSRSVEARFATASELRVALEEALVDCNLSATTDDVAAFFAGETSARSAKRRARLAAGPGARAGVSTEPPALAVQDDPTLVEVETGGRGRRRRLGLLLLSATLALSSIVALGTWAARPAAAPGDRIAKGVAPPPAPSTPARESGPVALRAEEEAAASEPPPVQVPASRPARARSGSSRAPAHPAPVPAPVAPARPPGASASSAEPAPSASSSASASCEPPYVVDAEGRHWYRRECLL